MRLAAVKRRSAFTGGESSAATPGGAAGGARPRLTPPRPSSAATPVQQTPDGAAGGGPRRRRWRPTVLLLSLAAVRRAVGGRARATLPCSGRRGDARGAGVGASHATARQRCRLVPRRSRRAPPPRPALPPKHPRPPPALIRLRSGRQGAQRPAPTPLRRRWCCCFPIQIGSNSPSSNRVPCPLIELSNLSFLLPLH
ncbi:hypothetical protein PVAP13_3KG574200 [Panicum virgatum]|nr:hypothetical protein PVAP13_3KG574200 [Panicum virgatum]